MVEQRTENPCVVSSILTIGTKVNLVKATLSVAPVPINRDKLKLSSIKYKVKSLFMLSFDFIALYCLGPGGRVARQRSAKPRTRVRVPARPPKSC